MGSEFIYLPLRLGHSAVTEFRYPAIVTGTLSRLRLDLVVLQLLTGCLDAGKDTLLFIPLLHQDFTLCIQVLELFIDLVKLQ